MVGFMILWAGVCGCCVVLKSPSEDGPGIMYIMHIMSPQLQKRKLHQGITENTLAEAS
jgi:acyl-CoA reductase-like NAD-dependent aldehyde dehydrogenase